MDVQTIAAIIGLVVIVASALTNIIPTPSASEAPWKRSLYAAIEWLAMVGQSTKAHPDALAAALDAVKAANMGDTALAAGKALVAYQDLVGFSRPTLPPAGPAVGLVLLLIGSLTACQTTGGAAWTPAQSAYVEVVTVNAAISAAQSLSAAPGLSDLDKAAILAGVATTRSALTGAVQAMAAGGQGTDQALVALAAASTSASSSLLSVLAAHRGGTAKAGDLALTGGITALGSLPVVLMAIERVRSGYQPTPGELVVLALAP